MSEVRVRNRVRSNTPDQPLVKPGMKKFSVEMAELIGLIRASLGDVMKYDDLSPQAKMALTRIEGRLHSLSDASHIELMMSAFRVEDEHVRGN